MHFRYFLGGSTATRELSAADLKLSFRVSPEEEHPFLTLKDYFSALEQFVAADNERILHRALAKLGTDPADFSEARLYSEKHGAFYHIARVVLCGFRENNEFAITTALTESSRKTLAGEYSLLRELGAGNPGCFPEVYGLENVRQKTAGGTGEYLMLLGEWLTGFYEWHLGGPAPERINLWNSDHGHRFLSAAESFELLRQAAAILTRCYDQESFCQVYPWHHGAGDFVARNDGGGEISVKLITVRQHAPLVHFEQAGEGDRLVAAIHFLLNLAVRMRLDRRDGVGEPLWFDAWAAAATVAGFFAGLAGSSEKGRLKIGTVEGFLQLMQSFDVEELHDMHGSLLEIYRDEDEDDYRLIRKKLPGHATELHAALQGFSL
jgi:hypothetical protein